MVTAVTGDCFACVWKHIEWGGGLSPSFVSKLGAFIWLSTRSISVTFTSYKSSLLDCQQHFSGFPTSLYHANENACLFWEVLPALTCPRVILGTHVFHWWAMMTRRPSRMYFTSPRAMGLLSSALCFSKCRKLP